MVQIWHYQYTGNHIIVKNGSATELLINDQLVDKKTGIHLSVKLSGKLPSGEIVTAEVIGLLDEIKCSVHVNNLLLTPEE